MKNPFSYFKTSPEIIRLAVLMYIRFPLSLRQVEDLLQKFASIHASVHNHFNQDRHLNSRQVFKIHRSSALAEWRQLAAYLSGQGKRQQAGQHATVTAYRSFVHYWLKARR